MASKNNSAWERKYEKVKKLAERGIGGEKKNAQAILERMNIERQIRTAEDKKYTYTGKRNGIAIFDLRNPKNGQEDIIIPYYDELGEDVELWHEITKYALHIVQRKLGGLQIQNSARRITVACSDLALYEATQAEVNDLIWHMLMAKGIQHLPRIIL